jgi:hypothetical protein
MTLGWRLEAEAGGRAIVAYWRWGCGQRAS